MIPPLLVAGFLAFTPLGSAPARPAPRATTLRRTMDARPTPEPLAGATPPAHPVLSHRLGLDDLRNTARLAHATATIRLYALGPGTDAPSAPESIASTPGVRARTLVVANDRDAFFTALRRAHPQAGTDPAPFDIEAVLVGADGSTLARLFVARNAPNARLDDDVYVALTTRTLQRFVDRETTGAAAPR